MAKATISRNVNRIAIITSGTAVAPAPQVQDQGFPSGDQAIRSLTVRYDATITGTSTPTRITNGHIFWLNAITIETDKHGKIVDTVDGLMLYTINQYDFGTAGQASALSATPSDSDTPNASWKIPFTLFRGIRPYDTCLDMQKARMKVTTTYGTPCGVSPTGNLWTQAGGTPQVTALNQSIEAKILPGPLDTNPASSELPTYIRAFEQKSEVITATETRHQIPLPFGDRIWRRLFITQRNSSSKIEMSNVIAATAEVSLYLNNIPIVDRRLFRDIQAENKLNYGIESLPTGVIVLDFDDDTQERIFDMLWALTLEAGNMFLFVDVTTQTNASILLGYDTLKPIPPAAVRG